MGAAQRALELTVAYTKARVQFGRPIGGFQALQHRMADLLVLVESARALSYAAAEAAAETAGAAPPPQTAAPRTVPPQTAAPPGTRRTSGSAPPQPRRTAQRSC